MAAVADRAEPGQTRVTAVRKDQADRSAAHDQRAPASPKTSGTLRLSRPGKSVQFEKGP